MPDKPFDITPIGFLEKPLSVDHNQNSAQVQQTLRELFRAFVGTRTSSSSPASKSVSGFIGDGLRVVPSSPAAMSVQVTPGIGFIYAPSDSPNDIGAPDIQGLDDFALYKPIVVVSPITFPITAPSSGGRIDIIEVKVDRRLENATARRQFDSVAEAFVPKSYSKTLSFALDGRSGSVASPSNSTAGISYKIGVESGSPVAPATSPGYVKIAEVRTGSGSTSIVGTNISDKRKLLAPGGVIRADVVFTLNWNGGAPTATVLHTNAPPGVEIGVLPMASKGYVQLFAVAGEFTGASVQYSVLSGNSVVSNTAIDLRQNQVDWDNLWVPDGYVRSAEQSVLASATPPVNVGQAQMRFATQLTALYRDNTGDTSSPGVVLDNLRITASLSFSYY